MKFIISLCFAFLGLAFSVFAGPAEDFAQALELQKANKTDEAIALYEKICSTALRSPEVHNNLGLAYLQKNNLGLAVLHFQKALRLAPAQPDALHNLAAAQNKIANLPEKIEASGIAAAWQGIAQALSPNAWAIAILLLALGLAAALYKLQGQQKWTFSAALFSILLLAAAFGASAHSTFSAQYVVAIKPKVGLRQQPNLQAQEVDFIHEGTTARVLDTEGDWLKLQFDNGLVGWLPAALVELV